MDLVPFRLKLTGGTAESHQFQGYDGYMALAGFAWTLSLVANYADSGSIRHRGEFAGRHAVRAKALEEGSIVADFSVQIQHHPIAIFGASVAGIGTGQFLTFLVKKVINSNLGKQVPDEALEKFLERRGGDVEALVAITEAPIRQAHNVIGNGADTIRISGGINIIDTFNAATKDYVRQNVIDETLQTKTFSVSAFNANSGYGSVFDSDIGRVVPFSMNRDKLQRFRSIFSWGLDQYSNRTGGKISATFSRILAMDDRPKRYVIHSAKRDT